MSDSTAIQDPRVGTVVQERYRLLQRVAAGGMGVVYRGERVGLGRQVAVKFLHPWIAGDASFKSRFELEAQVMGRLDHPCCVSIIDSGMDADAPFLVMDYVTGPTLRLVVQDGPLLPARAISLMRQALAGLTHAHAHGIVHRDLKPENIVLTDTAGLGEQVRLLDFGLARLRDAATGLTMGLVVGTPNYMPPEQVRAEAVDERTDLYALGIVLFELLTGKAPFAAAQASEILHRQVHAPPPQLRDVLPDAAFSDALESSLARALAKSPEARFQSASEFARALEETPEFRAALMVQATGTTPLPVPPPRAAPAATAPKTSTSTPDAAGAAAPNLVPPGEATPGEATPAAATPAEAAPDTATPNEVLSGAATPDASLSGTATPDDATPGAAAPHPAPPDASAQATPASRSPANFPPPGALTASSTAARQGSASAAFANGALSDEAIAPTHVALITQPAPPVHPGSSPSELLRSRLRTLWPHGGAPPRPLVALAAFLLLAVIGLIGFAGDRAEGVGDTVDRKPAADGRSPDALEGRGAGGGTGEEVELARVRKLAADGHRDRALRAIGQHRRQHPQSAAAAVLQGQINFHNLRWADGLASYRDALRLSPRLRADAGIIQDVIDCLVSDRAYRSCATFLLEDVGAPAIPHLEEAARASRYANVQVRARELLERGSFRSP